MNQLEETWLEIRWKCIINSLRASHRGFPRCKDIVGPDVGKDMNAADKTSGNGSSHSL